MSADLRTLFERTSPTVPVGLLSRIGNAIEGERLKQARARVKFATSSAFLSLGGFFWYLSSFGGDLAASEFWQIMSLAFSDFSLVGAYWKEFSYSLAETFPTMPASFLVALLFLHFLSLAFRSRYVLITASHKTTHQPSVA